MNLLMQESDFGSSGYYLYGVDDLTIETDWGDVPCSVMLINRNDVDARIFFIHMHHGENVTPPHNIEYRANVSAARACKPDLIVSIQSVGSMCEQFPPGVVGLAEHTLDFTGKPVTFSEHDAVHTDMSEHYPESVRSIVRPLLERQGESMQLDHVVAQIVGPQFETPAEIKALAILGATTTNMTIASEAKLVAETGIDHLGLIASSNWAAGFMGAGEIDHTAVESEADKMRSVVWQCLTELLAHE